MKGRNRWIGAGVVLVGLLAANTQWALGQDAAGAGRPAHIAFGASSQTQATAPAAGAALAPSPPQQEMAASALACDNCCEPCGLPGRFWFRGEYLHWWTKGARVPPLVATVTDPSDPTNTMVTLFGDSTINGSDGDGFRVNGGMWLDACHIWGIEGDYFDLGRHENNYDSGFSNGFPILVRPFYNPQTMHLDGELVAWPTPAPNALAGRVTVDTKDYFQGTGLGVRRNLYCCECSSLASYCDSEAAALWRGCGARWFRVDAIAGYRYFRFFDSLAVHESLVNISTDPANVGRTFDVRDSFKAHNEFQGIDVGLAANMARGRWTLDLGAKVSLGNSHQVVDIAGQTSTVDPLTGAVATVEGGLLAQTNSNIGHHVRDRLCAIPQLTAEIGCQLLPNFRAYAGYDVLYWDRVLRAAEQIDFTVDPGNIPGSGIPAISDHPEFHYREASFWAHGFHVGGELRF